jgi:Secretion system C-terminal sorting domain
MMTVTNYNSAISKSATTMLDFVTNTHTPLKMPAQGNASFKKDNTKPTKPAHEIYNTEILPDELFSILPNPTNDGVISVTNNIYTGAKMLTVNVVDAVGKIVNTFDFDPANRTATYHLQGIAKGIYFVNIMDGNKLLMSTKLVVNVEK